MKFKEETIVKGKELNATGMKFYKVLKEDMKHHNMQYVEGENTDILEFYPRGNCNFGGLYFTDIDNIYDFLEYGNHMREVTFSDNEDIYVEIAKFKAHTITLGPAMMFDDIETWKTLVENGANINICDDFFLKTMAENGYLDPVKYLLEQGADINAGNGYSLKYASSNGHLDMVKYLVENGANIHIDDDYALRYASNNGHLDIVKYLTENGIDVQINNDYALVIASKNGYLDIVKYLLSKGVNIHTSDNYSLKYAAEYGHLNVVKYLISKGANINILNKCYIDDEKTYNYLKRKGIKVKSCF